MKHLLSEDMIINSFRYCLGRRTYVVSDFVHEIIPIVHELSNSTRQIMLRDLQECNNFGMEMDKAEWLRLKKALQEF